MTSISSMGSSNQNGILQKMNQGFAETQRKSAGAQCLREHRYDELNQKLVNGEITTDEFTKAKAQIDTSSYNDLYKNASTWEKVDSFFTDLNHDENSGSFMPYYA